MLNIVLLVALVVAYIAVDMAGREYEYGNRVVEA